MLDLHHQRIVLLGQLRKVSSRHTRRRTLSSHGHEADGIFRAEERAIDVVLVGESGRVAAKVVLVIDRAIISEQVWVCLVCLVSCVCRLGVLVEVTWVADN